MSKIRSKNKTEESEVRELNELEAAMQSGLVMPSRQFASELKAEFVSRASGESISEVPAWSAVFSWSRLAVSGGLLFSLAFVSVLLAGNIRTGMITSNPNSVLLPEESEVIAKTIDRNPKLTDQLQKVVPDLALVVTPEPPAPVLRTQADSERPPVDVAIIDDNSEYSVTEVVIIRGAAGTQCPAFQLPIEGTTTTWEYTTSAGDSYTKQVASDVTGTILEYSLITPEAYYIYADGLGAAKVLAIPDEPTSSSSTSTTSDSPETNVPVDQRDLQVADGEEGGRSYYKIQWQTEINCETDEEKRPDLRDLQNIIWVDADSYEIFREEKYLGQEIITENLLVTTEIFLDDELKSLVEIMAEFDYDLEVIPQDLEVGETEILRSSIKELLGLLNQ